jgi:hypothetical protein
MFRPWLDIDFGRRIHGIFTFKFASGEGVCAVFVEVGVIFDDDVVFVGVEFVGEIVEGVCVVFDDGVVDSR